MAAEDALLDTCICKQEARDICEALDRHLITAAVTGSLCLIAGAAGKGSLPYRLDSQKSGMREGDVDVSAWKETHDTRRHWEKETDLVVWWRAKWRCGCCDRRGNERGGGWGGAGSGGSGNITQPLASQDGCGDGSSEADSSSGRAGAEAAAAESSNGGNPAAARRAVGLNGLSTGTQDGLSWINNISHSSEDVLFPTPQQQQPQTSRPSNAASDGDGGSDSTQPLACGGGGSDTAQPPAESDGDGGSGIAQPLASWGSEGAVDFQQWRAAHGYRYYSSCSSSSSEGPECECPEYGD